MTEATTRKLTPARFDRLIGEPSRPTKGPKLIWGATAIAARLGVSADFVRDRLVNEPDSPIVKRAGKYCAIEGELIDWFRS
jgi:hypothetical protein